MSKAVALSKKICEKVSVLPVSQHAHLKARLKPFEINPSSMGSLSWKSFQRKMLLRLERLLFQMKRAERREGWTVQTWSQADVTLNYLLEEAVQQGVSSQSVRTMHMLLMARTAAARRKETPYCDSSEVDLKSSLTCWRGQFCGSIKVVLGSHESCQIEQLPLPIFQLISCLAIVLTCTIRFQMCEPWLWTIHGWVCEQYFTFKNWVQRLSLEWIFHHKFKE